MKLTDRGSPHCVDWVKPVGFIIETITCTSCVLFWLNYKFNKSYQLIPTNT